MNNDIIKQCEKGGPCKHIREEVNRLINSGYTVELEIVKRYKGLISEVNISYTNASGNGGVIYYGY